MNESRSIQAQFWELQRLLAARAAPAAGEHRAEDLENCFRTLAEGRQPVDRQEAENEIWAIWCDHPDPEARLAMEEGIACLSRRALKEAEGIFDALITRWPEWAEGWNKRATLRFLQGRDADSVADIHSTLQREPRHFGALGGFAQIAMRNRNADAALSALEALVHVNPHADGIKQAIAALRAQAPRHDH